MVLEGLASFFTDLLLYFTIEPDRERMVRPAAGVSEGTDGGRCNRGQGLKIFSFKTSSIWPLGHYKSL